jgi:DNA-binding response OmpR family regulator
MQATISGSVILLGNSNVSRELAAVLPRFDARVKCAKTSLEAIQLLDSCEVDLLVVELVAVGWTGTGLYELAEAARQKGTRLALLTSRSVMDTAACATLVGAMATLNKWTPVRVTAERIKALAGQARAIRQLGMELSRPFYPTRIPSRLGHSEQAF